MNNKLIVYTTIFANRDPIREPLYVTPNCRYICFTDQNLKSKTWEIVKTEAENPRLEARRHKLLPHVVLPVHDINIWQDGSMRAYDNLLKMTEELGDPFLGIYPHRYPWTIFRILANCKKFGWDNDTILDALKERYEKENYPADTPTFETGIIIRKNNSECNKFNDTWWHELSHGSIRDQASFSYVVWKLGAKIKPLNGRVNDNPYFKFIQHKQSRPHYDDPQMRTSIKFL